ncbi:MAG TPA: GNAT family N-acetyltransferase [Mycobacterium sp.]
MEPIVRIARAESVDLAELAGVAARTFPLACPPSVTPANIAAFVEANLSEERFAEYQADPQRVILAASRDGRIVGYAMLIHGVGDDRVELSKLYVLPDEHGSGTATALMNAALDEAAAWGASCVWLGVNQKNARAQRFYKRCGFTVNGVRTFQLGAATEDDYVMVREL